MKFTALVILALCFLAPLTCALKVKAEPGCMTCVAIDADRLAERPKMIAGQIQPQRLWGQPSKFWPQRKVLKLRFLDGSKTQQDKAWQRFAKIDSLVNLTFVRVADGASDFRVSFKGEGHWSYLGRDCATIPQSQPTMNLQLSRFDFSKDYDRVALHEMLHAIGIDHEQAHPQSGIRWNKPVVYAYYAHTQGWSRTQTDQQVLYRFTGTSWNGSAYDPASIMHYPVEAAHTLDGKGVGWNYRLSPVDIATLERLYPTSEVVRP